MWLDIVHKHDNIRISKAWIMQKNRHYTAKSPWQVVKGPIGATIATLELIGWNPISPFRWIDHLGNSWRYQEGVCRQELIRNIRHHVKKQVWINAAGHMDGQGLENGPDFTAVAKHLKRLHRIGDSNADSQYLNDNSIRRDIVSKTQI